jgi:TolB-like protein/Tfp pilus assembly protein PilF
VSKPSHAVFLSYASQDAQAAQRIAEALRAAGIEVWFDQSELRGGDAWDQSIRKQIKGCALFVPVISQHTHERGEGYFRLEWKLAVDRCHLMAADKPFLVPVVIDDTPGDDERVPEKFRELQWTRLPGGYARPEFATRIRQLLSGESNHSLTLTRASAAVPSGRLSRPKPGWLALAVGLAALAAYLLIEKPWAAKPAPLSPAAPTDTPVAFNPPPHSIAVLPFVNMSGDKEQEYFSDGLSEELLNDLARITELQVAARTSAFSFKGKETDIGTIARKLNVGAVLEGSVRRSGHTLRVTAQLNDALTGFHVWSQTYDRDVGDMLKLQTDIASAVAGALKVTLLSDIASKIEVGGTRNPAAFDAYLRATKTYFNTESVKDLETAIAMYTEAIRLDSQYALAFAGRSIALEAHASDPSWAKGTATDFIDRALADAKKAITLAPNSAEGHLALAYLLEGHVLDFTRASEEYDRALTLGPGEVRVVRNYGVHAALMGHPDAGIAASRHAVVLDPLNARGRTALGHTLMWARHYSEALAAYQDAITLEPALERRLRPYLGLNIYYQLGDYEKARSLCEYLPPVKESEAPYAACMALIYKKLGRQADADASLARLKALEGDAGGFDYAEIYAQWGDSARALEWLERAFRLRVGDLWTLRVDPLLDPLRREPRFQAIERELKFP